MAAGRAAAMVVASAAVLLLAGGAYVDCYDDCFNDCMSRIVGRPPPVGQEAAGRCCPADRGMHTAEVCSESAPRVPVGGGDTNSCPKLEQENEDKLSSIHIH
ncbi:unnamed protein product [Miscanthus lutarioriparius]|uniref:Uncharacterized protein n=1 Tax=Miscanthus lutarioriparius TaxID=422564 RepID=A0A811P5Z6_9POAL|nr:unnamed protein product [Miscanthus lutarioriparius]